MPTFAPLLDLLADIPDPRLAEGKLSALPDVLLFAILAIVAGSNSYRGVVGFIDVNRARLNRADGTPMLPASSVPSARCSLGILRQGYSSDHARPPSTSPTPNSPPARPPTPSARIGASKTRRTTAAMSPSARTARARAQTRPSSCGYAVSPSTLPGQTAPARRTRTAKAPLLAA